MIVLDSDHLTVVCFPQHSQHARLQDRIDASGESFATTIVCAEEQMRGWLALIRRARDIQQQIVGYRRLGRFFDELGRWVVLPFGETAAEQFERLRKQRLRIGTMDLKIAAITLTHAALLLSANLQDYRKVPGLRFENWLKE